MLLDVAQHRSGKPLVSKTAGTLSGMHETDAAENGTSSFSGHLSVEPGRQLTVAPQDPKPYGHYDVLADDARVGALVLGGPDALARMICADGDWRLQKRRRLGWELLIESREGQQVGWYSGRKWLSGGTISLTDNAQFDLRRSPSRRWKLRATGRREAFLDIRTSGAPSSQRVVVAVRLRPGRPEESRLVFLTACAVLMLDRMTGFVTISSAQ